jgi:hypothetical protein
MENAASDASGKSGRREVFFELPTCRRMLPLVRRIVQEIRETQTRLGRMRPEREGLDRDRRELSWPERSRRYQLQEEIAAAERQLGQVLAELEQLGVVLVDTKAGWVGFPTIVNGRGAYFSWRPGEEEVRYWHFAGESVRRLIPRSWLHAEPAGKAGGS